MTAAGHGARLLRGIGALLLLVGVIIGVPAALVILGGNPLPATITWADLREALFTPDDGTILLGLITIIGWLAWAVFALSVIIELITVVSRHRIRIRLPGLAGPQRAAAGLLVAVATMITTPPVVVDAAECAGPARTDPSGQHAAVRATVRRSRRWSRPPGRPVHSAVMSTSYARATTCGPWPSVTTGRERTGAGSPRPTRLC